MTKILGLDLGTNSIGWGFINNDTKTIDTGVITFQQGVALKQDGSNEEPLNVAKRNARQMRRQVFYKDYRLTKMTEVLARFDMFPYLKTLDDKKLQETIIQEIKDLFVLDDQALKNYKLNKYKDNYQLNARIAKLILSIGLMEKKSSGIKVNFDEQPQSLDNFIEHLLAFISMDTYQLRSTALSKEISRMQFGRILYQIGKRRGFKSSRKVKNKDEGEGNNTKKKFKKNDKKKNWQEEIKKLREKYGDELQETETDDFIEVQYPKALTEFYEKLDKTKKAIEDGKYKTLGNYLFHKNSHEERIRKETKAERSLYIEEFNILWENHAERLGFNVQSGEMRKKKKELIEISLKDFLGDPRKGILFYQRPLKSQKHLVAKCSFANKTIRLRNNATDEVIKDEKGREIVWKVGKSRCLISHPLYEKFRALQQINNLKIKRNNTWHELSPSERNRLFELFTFGCNESGKIAISKVLNELGITKEQLKGAAEGDVEGWKQDNEETDNKKQKGKKGKAGGSLAGNYTLKKLSELLGPKWGSFHEFPENLRKNIREKTIRKLGGENIQHDRSFKAKDKDERKKLVWEQGNVIWKTLEENEQLSLCLKAIQEEIWHCFSFYEDNVLLFEKLKYYGLEDEKKEELKKINLKSGYGSLSIKAIRKILPFMEKGLKYTDAIFLANVDEVFGREQWLMMSSDKKQNIYNNIENFIRNRQLEKIENDVKNSVLSVIKKKYEKLSQSVKHLDENLLKDTIRKKSAKYLEEVKGVSLENEFEENFNRFFLELKPMLKNPARPNFQKTKPVVEQIKNYLCANYNINEMRLKHLWHPAKVEHLPHSPDELPEPKFQTLRNPIVKQALYALRSTVKHIESKHGKPDLVRIELARELNDKNKRIAIRKWNKMQENNRERIKKRLAEYSGIDPDNEENILKYKLWEELQEINSCHVCPYTGAPICFDDLFVKNKFQIEHIIPKSRCWSDAEVNLTLCATSFNEYKHNRTPFELQECENFANYKKDWSYNKILDRVNGWKEKSEKLNAEIESIKEDLKGMPAGNIRDSKMQKKHRLTFEKNYYRSKYKRFIIDNLSKELNEGEEFLKSLITDTSYISKLAAIYLKSYFGEDKVQTVKGATTSMLRDEWNLGDKNRENHFHHAEDAIIIAFTNLGVYQELAQHRKKEKQIGTLYHPWGIKQFKDKFTKAIQNIAVYDKQRNKKITMYKKVLHQKGKKRRIVITSVRGELHEANAHRQINDGMHFSKRRPFVDLTPENWMNNIPEPLKRSWEPIDEIKDKKQLKSVKIKDIEKPVPLSKLMFSQIEIIEDETIKELIEKRIKENGITNTGKDEMIPKEAFSEKLFFTVTAKGKGEIKKCEIKIIKNGKEKIENRKFTKAEPGKKQTGKLLRLDEIPSIADATIKKAVIGCLKNIIENPEDIENIKKEFENDVFEQFINAVNEESFDIDIPLPTVFFEKKIRTSLSSFGIPIKKVTLKERNENGNKVRKKIEDLTFGDIPNLTEPAKTIIEQKLKEISAEKGSSSQKLPDEFYKEKIYVPVKNVRTHKDANLFPVRKKSYFRFGKTDHAIIYQDTETNKYFIEAVPFYFVINPQKYTDIERLDFIHKIEEKEKDVFASILMRLLKITEFRKRDYFILNTESKDAMEFNEEVEEQITKGENFNLQEKLYKVMMISANSFDIQFRKHYSAKSQGENINIKSSDKWKELNPIKVKVSHTGKIERLNND
jgi:CRISPR-associated endonuclease Csn1